MLGVVIIDDEERIRYLIKRLIPQDRLGITVIGEADNGIDGLELCLRLKPDIVLTDIRMPGKDGLALTEQIGRCLPRTKVIIISGYDDFSFAQKAIKIGAFDYILKPVEDEDFIKILEKVKLKIQEEASVKDQLIRIKTELNKIKGGFNDFNAEECLRDCPSDNIIIQRTLAWIHEGYNTSITLEEAAEKAYMNITYFSQLFKKEVGKGFNEYVTELRLNYAKKLLRILDLKIIEIGDVIGYQDVNYFIRVFKKHNGMTPAEYRQKLFNEPKNVL